MAKQKKGKAAPSAPQSSKRTYQVVLVVAAVVAAVAVYFHWGRDVSPGATERLAGAVSSDYTSTNPALRNRMILPALPHETRPVTLPPESFSDDEVRRSYQAAKDHPEVLETVACYCGCYAEAGHRNNLDCYRDNHGIT